MSRPLNRLLDDPIIHEAANSSLVMLSTRALIVAILVPLTGLTVGWTSALIWSAGLLLTEGYAFWAARAVRGGRFGDPRIGRFHFLFAAFWTISAWLGLSLIYWFSGEPALMLVTAALWAGQLIYVQSFMHGATASLLVGAVPTLAAVILVPVFFNPFEGAQKAATVAGFWLVAGFAIRAVQVFFRLRRELEEANEALRRRKREVETASEAKSTFLATMSHELRTPLNGVLGMAHALKAEPMSTGQVERVDAIIDSGNLLTALLNDVLDMSKIEAGKMEIAPVEDDLVHALRQAVRLFEPAAAQKGVRLDFDPDPEIANPLRFDPVRVRQCAVNLLSNAVKFTEAGAITLSVRPEQEDEGQRIVITVSDTGIGMDAETVNRLFAPFVQADASITRRFAGTGLGLSIVRRLARLMGGDVSVESAPGKGSVFTLTFLAGAPARQPVPANEEPTQDDVSIRGRRVLLVDDNPVNRQVASIFLKELDCEVVEAREGSEALERLAAGRFDLVLLDLHMPGMDGMETIARIRRARAAWSEIPVAALTADAMGGEREECLRAGMDSYIPKPFEPAAFHAGMSEALARTERRGAA